MRLIAWAAATGSYAFHRERFRRRCIARSPGDVEVGPLAASERFSGYPSWSSPDWCMARSMVHGSTVHGSPPFAQCGVVSSAERHCRRGWHLDLGAPHLRGLPRA